MKSPKKQEDIEESVDIEEMYGEDRSDLESIEDSGQFDRATTENDVDSIFNRKKYVKVILIVLTKVYSIKYPMYV